MNNRLIKYNFILLIFSVLYSITIDEGMAYTLSIDKNEVKGDDIVIILSADIKIDKGYYMLSSDTSLSLNPTHFEWEDSSIFKNLGQIIEPKPTVKYEKIFDQKIGKHFNKIKLIQSIIPKDNIAAGEYDLKGEFVYQVCDSLQCMLHWDPVNFRIKIYDYNNYNSSLWVDIYSMISSFFIAFFAGLIAILTPCVFPMIPMTVAFFAKSSKKGSKESIKTGLLFGISIILIFMIIGVLFSAVFGAADLANELATSAIANIIFAIIFLIFAISFFGYFEIQVPTKLLNVINKKADGGGLLGIFFMALTLVLVSFSCTAPIVGTVMIDAVSGSILKPIIAMMGFSIAFAVPFSLFAIFPSWLESLPKSGGWLNSVKIILGFLELALCIKFLSMPDQAYHWGMLDRNIFLIIWIAIFGTMGFYILGLIKFKGDSTIISYGIKRISLAIITFCFCLYMGFGLAGRNVSLLAGIIPPPIPYNDTVGNCDLDIKYSDILHLPHGLKGYFDFEEARECAIELNKPIFIDFTGHACFNCRRMEENVWSTPVVKNFLEDNYVIVALYVDDKTILPNDEWYVSDYDDKIKKTIGKQNFDFQIKTFNSNAQPYYVLLDNDGKLLGEPRAYNLSIDDFVEFLDNGVKDFYK